MNTDWVKASRSGGDGGDYLEVRWCDGTVQVRDSKDPDGPVLTFSPTAWEAFVNGVAQGEFNR
jgi:hypothetical protein